MKTGNLIPILLVFALLVWIAPLGCAQPPVQGMKTTAPGQEGSKITVKGKIASTRSGYFLNGEEPPGRFIIANENPQVLGELAKQGNIVTVEGRLTYGADYLFIEKIDGKRYQGAKEPDSK